MKLLLKQKEIIFRKEDMTFIAMEIYKHNFYITIETGVFWSMLVFRLLIFAMYEYA